MPELLDWQKKLLERAREIWEAGEGEIVFSVFTRPPSKEKHYTIKGGKVERGKEHNDK
jgi:ribosomal protein S17